MKTSIAAMLLYTIMLGVNVAAHAQNVMPFLASEGLETARGSARAALADDAVLVMMGAVGQLDPDITGGIPIQFHLDDGSSDAWAYVFYSASKDQQIVRPVVNIPGLGFQVAQAPAPVEIPKELTSAINTSLPYSNSDAMMTRLQTDAVYLRYRTDLPDVLPWTISYHPVMAEDSLVLPEDFPLDNPVWVVRFAGQDDSAMVCYVASATGRTFCLRATATASAPVAPSNDKDQLSISEASTPESLRILVRTADVHATTINATLFDASGRRIDSGEAHRRGEVWTVEFDAGNLVHGVYFCRVSTEAWSQVIPIGR